MIPAFADSRSLFGDASNTVAYAEKRKTIEDLIKNPSPERMIEIADLYNITAWIVGPTPLPLPNSWTKVDSFGDYAFVRVKRNTTRSEDLSASDQ